ncbi:MAG: hypothetical protein IPF40_12790 [Actinomycetales bacterium]|uniref:Uncharacterized protein n=1 Tax=Candidatus Phosphoribacter hodrii TaxID=2953743 RepID=A0A934X642_9MICO|nr:hypothetical protein [Candidatus Phosphoribacter hodrii]
MTSGSAVGPARLEAFEQFQEHDDPRLALGRDGAQPIASEERPHSLAVERVVRRSLQIGLGCGGTRLRVRCRATFGDHVGAGGGVGLAGQGHPRADEGLEIRIGGHQESLSGCARPQPASSLWGERDDSMSAEDVLPFAVMCAGWGRHRLGVRLRRSVSLASDARPGQPSCAEARVTRKPKVRLPDFQPQLRQPRLDDVDLNSKCSTDSSRSIPASASRSSASCADVQA